MVSFKFTAFLSVKPGRFWSIIYAATGLTLLVVIGILLASSYMAQEALKQNALCRIEATLDGKVNTVEYYLSERGMDFKRLAEHSAVISYFSGKASGMSMEYGLAALMGMAARTLADMQASVLMNGAPTYDRLAVLGQDGTVLIDHVAVSLADGLINDSTRAGVALFAAKPGKEWLVAIDPLNSSFLLCIAPISLNGHLAGYVAGWIPLRRLFDLFIAVERGSVVCQELNEKLSLVLPGGWTIRESENDPSCDLDFGPVISDEMERMVMALEGGRFRIATTVHLDCLPVWLVLKRLAGLELYLVYMVAEKNIVDARWRWPYFLVLSILALAGVMLLHLSARYSSAAQVLSAQLDAQEKDWRAVEQANQGLRAEMVLRVEAEQKLASEKSLLIGMIRSIPDMVFYTDSEGLCLGCNPAFTDFYHITENELKGLKASELLEGQGVDLPVGVFLNEQPVIQPLPITEHWATGYYGCRVLLETKVTPFYCAAGQLAGFISISRDITAHRQMLDKIAEQHAWLQRVINATQVGVWDVTVMDRLVTVNERLADIVGRTLEEMPPALDQAWIELGHPEDLDAFKALLAMHIEGESENLKFEGRMRHKDGSWVWVHLCGQIVLRSAVGAPLRISGILADISGRKYSEIKLRESEVTTYLESTQELIVVLDSGGHILHINPAVTLRMGYKVPRVKGLHVLDLFHEAFRAEAEELIAALMAQSRKKIEAPLLTRGGFEIPMQIQFVRGKWNYRSCIFAIMKDMTTEKEAIQRFERLFRSNPMPMALNLMPGGAFVDVNDAFIALSGYKKCEMHGKTPGELNLIPERSIDRLKELSRAEGKFVDCEVPINSRLGMVFHGVLSGELIHSDGKAYLLTVMVDISEQKRIQTELRFINETLEKRVEMRTRELEKVLAQMIVQEKMATVGLLASGIAHELNNPINFVATNLDTAKRYMSDLAEMIVLYRSVVAHMNGAAAAEAMVTLRDKEATLQIDFIIDDMPALFDESFRGFDRIARIITSMRQFSHNNPSAETSLVDINEGIKDTLILCRNTYKYVAEVATDLAPLPPIRCFPEQLNQVFMNLIVNSAQAIEAQQRNDRGQIVIRTWTQAESVFCEVSDDGPGIPAAIRGHIFDPFFTTKPPGQGTGLGLSICYKIVVENHRGELTVSCPEKGGTVFQIKIPIARQDSAE